MPGAAAVVGHDGPVRRPSLPALVVLSCCLLGACTAEPDEAGTEAPSPAAAASPSTGPPAGTAGPAESTSTEASSADTALTVSAPGESGPSGIEVVHGDDGVTTIRTGAAPGAPATITLDSPGRLRVNADSTVTILDDDGAPVAGLSRVTGGAQLTAVDTTTVHVEASEATTAETMLGTEAVESTAWGQREGGRSLAVAPTRWARSAGEAGTDLVWAELVAADPEVDQPGMHDQLVCHSIGAPAKDTWNLEPWRPDVGLVAVLADRCNPTD